MAPISWTRRSYEATVLLIPLDLAVHEADVVVVLAEDLAAVDGDAVVHIGDAARATGTLLGAVIVTPDARWSGAAAHQAATTIREAADNVILLKDPGLALAFLQVLRGGTHEAELAGATP